MSRRFAVVGVLTLVIAGWVGDSGEAYKPWQGVDLLLLFEDLEDHPDRDFYLKFVRTKPKSGKLDDPRLIRLRPGTPIHLTANGISKVFLLAMPRGRKPDPPDKGALAEAWLQKVPAGGIQSEALKPIPRGRPHSWRGDDRRQSSVDVQFRIRIDGETLDVVCVKNNRADDFGWAVWYLFAILAVFGGGSVFLKFLAWRRKLAQEYRAGPV